jgi:methionine synthase I (cobalamin-dependent)
MGPTGKLLQTEEVTKDEILGTYARQSEALWRGGADALLIETMIDLDEMILAAQAAGQATPLPYVFRLLKRTSCSLLICRHSSDGRNRHSQTQGPDIFSSFALRLRDAGANVIGACCGTTPGAYRI